MDRKRPPAADVKSSCCQRSDHGCGCLCHHVLLTFVESDLAERHGAHCHIDGGSDEAVDADLVVKTVDVLRRIFTV